MMSLPPFSAWPTRLFWHPWVILCLGLSLGCSSLDRDPWVQASTQPASVAGLASFAPSLPQGHPTYPEVTGFPGVRGRAGVPSPSLQASFEAGLRERVRRWRAQQREGTTQTASRMPYEVLVLGAGGPNGSFGAGLLCGWSASGQRPEFDVVTGVSAGALLAPFAFVGASMDAPLREAFAHLAPRDIYRERGLVVGLLGESIMDHGPLQELIERYVDSVMLEALATAHEAGRRLYIGTTDLDLGKLVIWDLGAIAVLRTPEALALVRDVLLASAAIPVFYPPVLFAVEGEGGHSGDELHVDGALASPMFLPSEVVNTWQAGEVAGLDTQGDIQATFTVIHNGALEPTIEAIDRSTVDIALRSFLMVSWSMVQEDVRLLFLLAKIWGAEFRFACVPEGGEVSVLAFDSEDAQRLFQEGYARGANPSSLQEPPPVSLVHEEWYGIQPLER